jgi:hypothetical protein
MLKYLVGPSWGRSGIDERPVSHASRFTCVPFHM